MFSRFCTKCQMKINNTWNTRLPENSKWDRNAITFNGFVTTEMMHASWRRECHLTTNGVAHSHFVSRSVKLVLRHCFSTAIPRRYWKFESSLFIRIVTCSFDFILVVHSSIQRLILIKINETFETRAIDRKVDTNFFFVHLLRLSLFRATKSRSIFAIKTFPLVHDLCFTFLKKLQKLCSLMVLIG